MTIAAQTEVELKLWVSPEDIATLRSHPQFTDSLHDHSREMLDTVYFDSDDLVLRDRGYNLRVRHFGDGNIQTLKSTGRGVGLFERSEWEQAIEGDEPDLSRVKDTALGRILVDDLCGALKPVFETRFERTVFRFKTDGADILMAIDEGRILATGASHPISEIELELKHGSPADLFKIARDILDIIPARLGFKSKPERGYELAGNAAITAEMASDPELTAGLSAGRAFTLVGRTCLRHMAANVPSVIARDVNALHQMRVALRRLRAAISVFSAVVADDRTEAIKTELRWLAQQLGHARDLDTLLFEVIKPLRQRHLAEPGLASISNSFARKRLKGYRQAQQALQGARFRALLLDTVEWVEVGSWSTSEDALARARRDMPIESFASQQLLQLYKKVRRRGARISELDPEPLHRLRIQVKKARYATEFFSGLYLGKKSAKSFEKARSCLTQLQASLGKLNDIATHKALFMEIVDHQSKTSTEQQGRHRAFAAGLIIGDQQARIEGLRDRARKAHSRFARARPFWKLPRRGGLTLPPVAEQGPGATGWLRGRFE